MNDHPVSELKAVKVVLKREDGSLFEQIYMMHQSQVNTFLIAQWKLHHHPGINPHNGKKTTPLWEMRVAPFESTVSYWWCSTELKPESGGAQIHPSFIFKRMWAHPDLLREETIAKLQMQREEYEMEMGAPTETWVEIYNA